MSSRAVLGLIALAALPFAGCASSTVASAPSAAEAPGADLESLYWERRSAARADFTPADVDFMTGMIGHHAQALVMSRLAPTHGASPAVQRLAARIVNAQNDEIESMQRWLRQRGQPVPVPRVEGLMLTVTMEAPDEADAAEGGMGHGAMNHGAEIDRQPEGMGHSAMGHSAMGHSAMDHGGMDHSGMPGMLSQAQLEELDAARGADFDRLFLRYMIQHHGGAITMVDTLFASDGAAQDDDAFKLASDINADQVTEIERMELMLRQVPD